MTNLELSLLAAAGVLLLLLTWQIGAVLRGARQHGLIGAWRWLRYQNEVGFEQVLTRLHTGLSSAPLHPPIIPHIIPPAKAYAVWQPSAPTATPSEVPHAAD
jgi:hypothetical protein